MYFNKLLDHYDKWELVLDDVIKADIKEFCNDDKYFIFEEVITPALTAFFRDPWVATHCRVQPNRPITGINDKERDVGFFPPCGVLPCSYFTRYMGPLSYMSDKVWFLTKIKSNRHKMYSIFLEDFILNICVVCIQFQVTLKELFHWLNFLKIFYKYTSLMYGSICSKLVFHH